jgi:hypothetical protein
MIHRSLWLGKGDTGKGSGTIRAAAGKRWSLEDDGIAFRVKSWGGGLQLVWYRELIRVGNTVEMGRRKRVRLWLMGAGRVRWKCRWIE